MTKGNLDTKFRNFVQKIDQQLANPFYKNVDLAVNIQLKDKAGNVLSDTTVKTNTKKKVNDIKLQIFLYPDGTYKINHQFSENYLKEFEKKWIEEAKARGLEVDISAMRKDIIGYLNSEEAEASFGKKFLREIRTWYDASVAGYIEGIQATQKVTMHIWDEGTINRGIWHSTNEDAKEYQQWPKYMHLAPVLGGATDGVVDEIVGIPIACKSIYEIATDDEKKKAFAKVFTKDGFNNLVDGFKNQATGILKDQQRLQHFTGQTTISVATTFAGVGAFNKVGKLDELGELVETAVKKGDDFIDGAATLSKIDELKKFVNHIEVRSAIDDLIKEFGSDTFDSHLDELLDAAKLAKAAKDRKSFLEMIKRFRLGRKFEANVTQRLEQELLAGSGAYVDDLAQKLGKTISELEAMPRLTQLQLYLPKEELIKYAKQGTKLEDLQDTWVTLDNVFVETIQTPSGIGYKLLANETKLSDLSPLTSNQNVFQKMLQDGKVEYSIRSVRDEVVDIFKETKKVTIGKWLQTTGKGVEEATDLTIKSLF